MGVGPLAGRFIAAYPVWGVLIIALDVLVIYAPAVHGREVKEMRDY